MDCGQFYEKNPCKHQENPKISIYVRGPDTKGCFQIKGDVELKTIGEYFEKMQETVRSKMAKAPAKGLMIVTIRDVFQCNPGLDAGAKLLHFLCFCCISGVPVCIMLEPYGVSGDHC